MDTLIPENDTLIPEEDAPQQSTRTRRERKRVSDANLQRINEFINAPSRFTSAPKPEEKPKSIGVTGTIKEGAKSTARALGAAVDTYQGDEAEVVAASKAQQAAEKDPRLASFLAAIADHKERLGPDPSLWESIRAVGSAALDNPAGAGLMVAEQIPNSAVALGAGGAGALAGSVAGPIGAIAGGLAGLTAANVGLETGHKAIEAAADEEFGAEDQERVTGEGAIKGIAVSGVDALTLGATKFITGASRRAVERATTKTLADQGVDVGNAAAVKNALADPAVMASVNEARKLAADASSTLGKRIAQTGGALALETIGEGAGEYIGEFAATGEANAVDAVVESLAGLSQSMGEVAFTTALNKRAMERLFNSQKEAETAAKAVTENTGVEHEVQPHPVEPEKFIAVPKTKVADGVELEQDELGNIKPKAPEEAAGLNEIRIQRAEGRAGFERSAEDKLLLDEKRRKNAEAYARNPLVIPGVDNIPSPANTPTINGKPVTGLSNGTLVYSVNHGSSRAKRVAQDELTRRKTEGIDPKIADAVSTPSEAVDHILKTGSEKAQETIKTPDVPKPTPKPIKPAPVPETTKAPAPKKAKPVVVKAPETPKPETPKAEPDNTVRPLIEALIKRRAVAHGELHRGSTFDKALATAKAMLAGEDVSPARFKTAATILKEDKITAAILNELHTRASEAKKTATPIKPKPELKSEPKQNIELDLSAKAIRERRKTDKSFKAVYEHLGEPHPESGPAAGMLRGWLDAKEGRPMDESRASRGTADMRPKGFNPSDFYRSAYYSYKAGKPIELRSLDPDPNEANPQPKSQPKQPPKEKNNATSKPEKTQSTTETTKPVSSGKKTPLVLPDGTNLDAQWDVVDADSVTASLKEGVNQPRDRSRAASDIQVQGIANNPDYRRLSDSPVMDVGAPTLSHDGLIVGGNGRFEGVSRAYDQGSGKDYLAQLKSDAEAKGISPEKISGMKKPVLVRRITTPFDTRKLAVASNSGTGMQYSAMEMAKIDAGRMKGLADLEVADNGDIALTGSNRRNIRFALGDYNAAELGALVDKDGALSQEGVRRIRNAMLYAAYGSNPTLERLVESTDNDLRNISGALIKAAGSAAKVRSDIEAGALPAELDISAELVNAVEALSKLKAQGMTVDEHLAQIGMFGDEMTENEKQILRVLGANIRSQKKVADFIRGYYDAVSRIDLTSGDMFGAQTPTKPELLANAKEKITERQPDTKNLFSRAGRTANSKSSKQPGNNESPASSGQKDRVKAVADSIRKGWKNAPEIVVLDSMADAPPTAQAENTRQLSQGATGEPEGFISEGKVHLVADQLRTPEDVVRVLLHESLGHFGLRGTFGQGIETVLKQVSALRRSDVEAKAKQYGLDINKQADRLIAAEEVLAELAQTNPKNTFVQRAFAAIRTWLRNNIPGFKNLALSDAEIIEGILIPARQFVQQSTPRKGKTRPENQTDTQTFKKWFGKSKVVDAAGKPLRVYHGTTADFNEFAADTGWFTVDPSEANMFGGLNTEGANIQPAFLSLQKPRIIEGDKLDNWRSAVFDALTDGTIDGVIVTREGKPVWVVATEPSQIKSATGNIGTFDSNNPDIRFSRATTAPTATPFRERIDKVVDSLIYNFQDRFKPLRDIQERAGPVAEDADASLAEERYSGTVRARADAFEEELRDPLLKAIHDSGVAYEDVEEYLHALHAPSRNAAMQEINPTESELKSQTDALEKQRDSLAKDADVAEYLKLRRELRQAEADIEDGIADESLGRMLKSEISQLKKTETVRDYTDAVDKLKGLRLVKPFKGDNTALSGMSNAEAEAVLAKIDANGTRKALDRISALVDTITSRTRQIYVESGLEKANVIEAWDKKYDHYVPLHRDEVNEGTMPKTGQGFNIRGKESKRATGSTKEATNILAHVVAQHEAAIIRSEKSKVDRALFRFAQLHPDPSLWTLDDAPMLRTVDQTTGFVVERVDPMHKNKPEVLTLKIDGDEHTITFNDHNPEAMRLAASMKNLSAQELGEVTQMVGWVTRKLATLNTTANPVFIARNFLRDLQTAYVNLSDTAIADKKAEVFRNVLPAIKGMWDLSRGKHNSQWAKYAEEFKKAGGQTGWMEHYNNIGERADSLRKDLEVMGPGKWNFTRRKAQAWWDIIQDANNAVENAARLAAFVSATKAGLSEGKAASIAKNLTVNFNTHGAKGVELNAWYMFMNASIQGTARLVKALSNKQVQKIVAGVIVSGFLMDIMARSMAGDDDEDGENDYDQLPEHVKSMNFVLMVDGRPVTIPMPYGYNFFASTGRKISEMMFRENYSAVKSAGDLVAVFLDAFSPTGQAGSALQYVAPTVADPFVQWSENRNFAGNPLRRQQNPFGVPNPEYQMGFKSTSAPAKWLAEVLNNETGGNEVRPGYVNVNPVFFDFAVSSIAGGAGRTYLQTVSGPIKAAQGDELQAREIPFLNIFFSARPEFQTERKYFEAAGKVETAKKELKTYRDKGDLEMVRQIREEHGAELRLIKAAENSKKILTRLRKRELNLDKTDRTDKAEVRRQIEERRREVMSRFNKRYIDAIAA